MFKKLDSCIHESSEAGTDYTHIALETTKFDILKLLH